jgi:hypothetical protein
MIWRLERPSKPALPNSYFWTWDHSTNWVLDDPGLQNGGCNNAYLKRPETFVEDYRRLSDFAAGLGVKGIVIWGFLRDSHGGAENSRRVAAYAASRGVAILPGIGTTHYGGVYYDGNHKYNLETFLSRYPEARLINKDGQPSGGSACPAHPAFKDWLREGMQWLLREFEVGGFNLENGDLLVDYHPLTRAARKDWPADDPEVFFFQGLSYKQVFDAVGPRVKDLLGTYATYSGFAYGLAPDLETNQNTASMGAKPPAMLSVLPKESIAQWTLSSMVRQNTVPMLDYLDNGAPAAAFENPNWPADLKPPSPRNVGFIHMGSQWGGDRYDCVLTFIKEACLRAYRCGMEGVGIHGEVTSRHIPYALNYLAFSHFIHWPEDSLREFGRKTLSQALGSEEAGEAFVEILAHWHGNAITEDHKAQCQDYMRRHHGRDTSLTSLERSWFWRWLDSRLKGKVEKHTFSFF